MRSVLFSLFLIFIAINSGIAQQEEFLQANNAYNEGDYNKAIALYEDILSSGDESSDLYLNLGNAYFRSDKLGKGILNYEKGLKLDRDHKALKQNLEYAKKQVETPITAIPDFFLSRYWNGVVAFLSSSGWAVLNIILFAFISIAIGAWLLGKELKVKRLAFYGMIFCSLMLIISLLAGAQSYTSEKTASEAIVTVDSSQLLTGASAQSELLLKLSEGVKVKLLDRIDDYYKVQLMDKETGWISVEEVETI